MARAPDERIKQAYELYKQGMKLVEIASQLNLPEGTVRRWKCTHKWDTERSDNNTERSNKKRGGQPGNKNATGPPGNKNAQKFGFFSKYLPEETKEIFDAVEEANPLDLLWHQIQIQYAAIIRAQQIMYVVNKEDITSSKIGHGCGETSSSEKWEYQYAWDKQANFLNAQSRAMKTLEGMINRYEELLHKNWDIATEEQRARIDQIKAQTDKITGNNQDIEDLDEIEGEIYGKI